MKNIFNSNNEVCKLKKNLRIVTKNKQLKVFKIYQFKNKYESIKYRYNCLAGKTIKFKFK